MEPIRVQILEDDENTALLLSAFLTQLEGVEVVGTARDGKAGLEQMNRVKPDLMLLDIIMPRMDGIEVLQALRQLPQEKRPYVIVLSGVQADPTVQRALKLGAMDFLMKPIRLERLADRIHGLFHQKGDVEPALGQTEGIAHWYLKNMEAEEDAAFRYVRTAASALAEAERGAALKVGYAQVIKVHRTSYQNTEAGIRRFLAKLHAEGKPGYQEFMGELLREKPPTNGEFLHRLADRIRGQMK